MALVRLDWPIVKNYSGFVSRNETGEEWTENFYYMPNGTTLGDNVPVGFGSRWIQRFVW